MFLAAAVAGVAVLPAAALHADPKGDRSGEPSGAERSAESRAAELESIVWTALANSGRDLYIGPACPE